MSPRSDVSRGRQQAVLAYIQDERNVSAAQRRAVVQRGRLFLSACPGAGKTRTVGVRLAYWATIVDDELSRPRRVAATSYTNTAVREITTAAERAGQTVAEPHFVGTLHRFLLRYVVRPFAAPLMETQEPLRVVAETASRRFDEEQISIGRFQTTFPVWNFEWRADGTVRLAEVPYQLRGRIDIGTATERGQKAAVNAKLALARRGLLSMSDVLYWAMKALEEDDVASVVASRFDELIVDEVQDTSDVQQRCIHRLHDCGLYSLVYAGDMEQAIYGFAHADPKQLAQLIEATTDEVLPLDENWRSSQAICDVSYRFCSRQRPDRAVGAHRDAGHPPELIVYNAGDPQQAVDVFTTRLRQLGIAAGDAVVLCRWGATTEQLRGEPDVKLGRALRLLVLGAAAVRSARAIEREVIAEVERQLLNLIDPDLDLDALETKERMNLRAAVMGLLDGLPGFGLDAASWARAARERIAVLLHEIGVEPPALGARIKAPAGAGHLTVEQIVGGAAAEPPIQTIHSAKGESHDATLVIAVDDANMLSSNARDWLGGGDPEEVRVAYVALSRARRYGALALSSASPAELIEQYEQRGFVAT